MMRRAFILAALAALGACNSGGTGETANQTDALAPAAPPPRAATPDEQSALAQWRQVSLDGCIGGARDRVRDPNVPVERHCACAIDREMANKTMADLEAEERSGAHHENFPRLLRQCIAEISPELRLGQGN